MISDNATKLWLTGGQILIALISFLSLLASIRNNRKLNVIRKEVNGMTHAAVQSALKTGPGFEAGRQQERSEQTERDTKDGK